MNVKTKRKKPGKSRGVTYADILAEKQARKRAIDKAAEDGMVELRANAHTQRAMWLMVCSVADAYGFGPERMKLFLETLRSNAEELQRDRRGGRGLRL